MTPQGGQSMSEPRVSVHPLRSLLFVPGHRERWLESARASGTDGVILDLEDSVPPGERPAARRIVGRALEEFGPDDPQILVRVGPPGTDALVRDLDAVVTHGLCAVVVPMVRTPDEIVAVSEAIDLLEAARGLAAGSVAIMPLVETALAARFSYEIATASPRVEYMGGGTSRQGDIARSLGFRWSAEGNETLMLRSWVLMNVRAAGLEFPITGLWGQVDDLAGCRDWAEQSRNLGYCGTMVIHPTHVPVVNEVFTPTPVEIERWEETIALMAARPAEGVGAINLRGQMIDEADVKTARAGLELARRLDRSTPMPPPHRDQ
jgi:citrate lyase subunit beta / citryl-CoA lyase